MTTSFVSTRRVTRVVIGSLVAAAMALLATASSAGTAHWGAPSPAWWLANERENIKVAEGAGLYQPKTDDDFAKHVKAARAMPFSSAKAWKNVGPFGGLGAVEGVGAYAVRIGKAGGIGTAIAVDPSDATGNTAYLGGFAGLFKTTDGGDTMKNITEGKLLRAAVGAVAVDPKNPKTLYVGTGVAINTLSNDAVGTGVYVSHDGGATFDWPAANTDGYGVNAIVVLADRSVLVGTNFGLWRSSDLGASFVKVPLPTNADHTAPTPKPLGNTVSSIAVRPGHPNELTLSVGWARGKETLSNGEVLAPGNGLYRSTQGGKPGTWEYLSSNSQLTWPGASSDPIGRSSITYASDNVMWALVHDAGRTAGRTPVTDLPSLPEDLQSDVGTGLKIALGTTVLNGVYRSEDNGQTWSLQATAQTLASAAGATTASTFYALYAAGIQSQFNNWIAADPTDPDRVYLGLEEMYAGQYNGVSTTPSTTWRAIMKYMDVCGFLSYPNGVPGFTNGVPCPDSAPLYGGSTAHPDQHAVGLAATAQGVRMYAGNDGGFWVQDAHALEDGTTGFESRSWRALNDAATVLPWDVTMLQDHSVVLALQDNGTNRLRPDGSAYTVCGGDGVYVWPGVDKDSYYCGIPGLFILGTHDDFRTTSVVTPTEAAPGTSGITGATFLSPFTVDRTDGNHLLAAAAVVMETTAGTDSNVVLSEPTGTNITLATQWVKVFTPPARADKVAWDASAAYVEGDVAYVGMCAKCRPAFSLGSVADPSKTVNAAIATNVKAGCTAAAASTECWHLAASKGLPHQQVSDIAVDPKDPRTLYVTLRQYLVMTADPKLTGDEKVMVSHDAGETFTDLSGNLPRVDAHAIELKDGKMIVATDVGIFAAPIGSKSWSRFGTGLPETPYRSMKMSLDGKYLVAGAYGRGAWVYEFAGPAKKASVKGVRKTRLPATGAESNIIFALLLLGVASVTSARVRRPT